MNIYLIEKGKHPKRMLRPSYFLKAKIHCVYCGKATHDLTNHMKISHGIGL